MSTVYHSFKVSLSNGQKTKLAKAYESNSPIAIRLSSDELTGSDELMLTKTQIKRIQKAHSLRKGVDISISKTQIRKSVQYGVPCFLA